MTEFPTVIAGEKPIKVMPTAILRNGEIQLKFAIVRPTKAKD
jgi:hypothetical protein